ncbi:MAG: phage tail protein [Saprospiraceae bacterium]
MSKSVISDQLKFYSIKNYFLQVIFSLMLISNGFSQNSGNGFSFQALIRDNQGAILKSTNVTIYLKINEQGNSIPLYEESHSIQTDEFGAIALIIGKGQKESGTLNKFSDINFGIGNLWYTVSILDNGTKREISNQKLISVPYAEYAYNVSPVPPGTILPFAGATVPSGYLACDGMEYSKSQYPNLYNAIQNIWGSASNGNNFKVPDFRGLFLRGVDGNANRDPDKSSRTSLVAGQNSGNNVGSYQTDLTEKHSHTLFTQEDADPNNTQFVGNENTYPSVKAFKGVGAWSVYNIVSSPSGQEPTMHKSKSFGGNETRPINVYVLYIIKI